MKVRRDGGVVRVSSLSSVMLRVGLGKAQVFTKDCPSFRAESSSKRVVKPNSTGRTRSTGGLCVSTTVALVKSERENS